MHAVFITFRSTVRLADLEDDYRQLAAALRDGAAPGFISKTWLSDEPTIGGFYRFHDRQAADCFLEEIFAPTMSSDPTVSDIRIERYDIHEELSAITNGLGAAAVGA